MRLVPIGLVVLAVAVSAAGEPEPLRFNPFAAPDLASLDAGRGETPAPTGDREGWEPILRATLRAGEGSLVDLGGVLLAVGESYRGWRLLEVREFEADFERHGERVTVAVTRRQEGGER